MSTPQPPVPHGQPPNGYHVPMIRPKNPNGDELVAAFEHHFHA